MVPALVTAPPFRIRTSPVMIPPALLLSDPRSSMSMAVTLEIVPVLTIEPDPRNAVDVAAIEPLLSIDQPDPLTPAEIVPLFKRLDEVAPTKTIVPLFVIERCD